MQPRSSIAAFLLIVCSLALLVVGWGSYKKVLAHNLHLAAKAGDSPQVETLLKRGANINAVEQYQTPIMRAIEEHQPETIRILLKHGADLHPRCDRENAPVDLLAYAAAVGDVESFRWLASRTPSRDLTPLLGPAASSGNADVVAYLLKNHVNINAPVNAHGETPLHLAATAEVARMLVIAGADPNRRSQKGDTPLHTTHDAEIAAMLVADGAQVNARNHEGIAPLHLAAMHGDVNCATVLLEHGANVAVRDVFGQTPLHVCAGKAVANALIAYGADIHSLDGKRKTPLHAAVRNNESEIAELLIRHGASMDARDIYGDRPLHELSFYSSKPQTADVLLRAGADINARNMSGQTTLYKTVAWQRLDCVMYLVEHNANVNIPDKSGATPLDIACRIDNHAIIDYLRRHGARHAANSWEEISPSARKVG